MQGLVGGSHLRLWTCYPGTKSRKLHHPGDYGHVSPGTGSGRMHMIETGYVTPNTVPERGHPGLKTCDLRYRIWEGVILETVDM